MARNVTAWLTELLTAKPRRAGDVLSSGGAAGAALEWRDPLRVRSPDGRTWAVTVDNNGRLSARPVSTVEAPLSLTVTTEAFTGSNGAAVSGWTTSGGTVNIQSNQYRLAAGAAGSYADTCRTSRDAAAPVDFEATVDVILVVGGIEQYVNVMFRGDGTFSGAGANTQQNGLYVEIIPGFNLVTLKRKVDGAAITMAGDSVTLADADVVHLRIRCEWDVVKVRYWLNSATEPTTWNWIRRDPEFVTNTRVSFGVLGGNDASAHTAAFDNLTVTALADVGKSAGPYPWLGLGMPNHREDYETLNLEWWYDWGATGAATYPTLADTYVPMVWGDWIYWGWAKEHPSIAVESTGADTLLGFNEPDNADQSNMTYTRALDLWPWLEAAGVRLGSPATTSSAGGVTWMDNFMAGADDRGLRVDVVCLHWYGDPTDDGDALVRYVRDALEKYGRPVWLTEFSGWQYSAPVNTAFATAVLPRLRDIPGLERIAWFTNRDGGGGYEHTGLVDATGALNATGEVYAAAGPRVAWAGGTAAFVP